MTTPTPPTAATKTEQHWPATIVACVGIAAITAVYAFSSPDQRSDIIAGVAVLWGTVQSFMPAIRAKVGTGASLLVLALLGATLFGCGHMSDAARLAYATEQAHCIANQRAIVERTGTTAEQDEADFDAEVARCDSRLAEIAGE